MLEAPEKNYASESRGSRGPRRVSASPDRKLRRDLSEDFADDPYWEDDAPVGRRKAGLRVETDLSNEKISYLKSGTTSQAFEVSFQS